jgi:hypothetical protein
VHGDGGAADLVVAQFEANVVLLDTLAVQRNKKPVTTWTASHNNGIATVGEQFVLVALERTSNNLETSTATTGLSARLLRQLDQLMMIGTGLSGRFIQRLRQLMVLGRNFLGEDWMGRLYTSKVQSPNLTF